MKSKEIGKLGAILCVICLVSSFILAYMNNVTKPIIEKQEQIASDNSRKEILPEADKFEKLEISNAEKTAVEEAKVVEVFKATKDGNKVGYTFKALPKGYGGEVEVFVGISNDGNITGVKVGRHNETPGLGAKASAEFKDQYMNKSVEKEIEVLKSGTPSDNQVIAIAGATITSKAVTRGVDASIRTFKDLVK